MNRFTFSWEQQASRYPQSSSFSDHLRSDRRHPTALTGIHQQPGAWKEPSYSTWSSPSSDLWPAPTSYCSEATAAEKLAVGSSARVHDWSPLSPSHGCIPATCSVEQPSPSPSVIWWASPPPFSSSSAYISSFQWCPLTTQTSTNVCERIRSVRTFKHRYVSGSDVLSFRRGCRCLFLAAAGPTPHNICRLYDARLAHTLYAWHMCPLHILCGLVVRVITRLTKTRSDSRVSRRNETTRKQRSGEVFVNAQRLVNAKTNRELKSATSTGLYLSPLLKGTSRRLCGQRKITILLISQKKGETDRYIFSVVNILRMVLIDWVDQNTLFS